MHTLPPTSPEKSARSARWSLNAFRGCSGKGSTGHDTTQKHGAQVSDAHPLTASESSNPWRYKLSYMEERDSKKQLFGAKSTVRVQPVPERTDDEHRGVTEPTSSALFLHMKVDQRAADRTEKKQPKKGAALCFPELNWMLLPLSRASVGSHYKAACLSPEAEQTWHFICLPSSDHTSQSLPPALADDRRGMQPADWLLGAPVDNTEQGRGREGGGGGLQPVSSVNQRGCVYSVHGCVHCGDLLTSTPVHKDWHVIYTHRIRATL